MAPSGNAPLELWGGLECTVNRVGDEFRDQLLETGHHHRADDLERIAELGIKTLRYPAIWERAQSCLQGTIDWAWIDDRLSRLRSLQIRPIVGLVHHGCGPRGTSLVSPTFISGLVNYARQLAERHPWIEDYTPVNEPLTTARFSGLYGHWYPHGRDPRTFQRALLIQCRAIAETMQVIRQINPAARLVQTDDLGQISSMPELTYQADFENVRRWASWDLLCGRIDRTHELYAYFLEAGANVGDLEWFLEHPCPPDIIGVNYYITSDRFLDSRLERYPTWQHGGNGRDRYADVETVRAVDGPVMSLGPLLRAAFERYRRPVVVTECHMGCTREQQLRWLMDVWRTAEAERASGSEIQAVTLWALLGLFDWNSLVTRREGHYEPGAFDLRSNTVRPTRLADCARSLATDRTISHPVLQTPGWWRKPKSQESAPHLMIAGNGALGQAFARICQQRGLAFRLVPRRELDIVDGKAVSQILESDRPWAVINAAGYAHIDPAEQQCELCRRENTTGPMVLANECSRQAIPLVMFSSSQVFDGLQRRPYQESDPVGPLNVFGRCKAEAELQVLRIMPHALIIRAGDFFGPWDQGNFVRCVLQSCANNQDFCAADDLVISPTYLPDVVHACLDLLIDGEQGVWHLSNIGAVTWAEFACHAAQRANYDPGHILPRSSVSLGLTARRPPYIALGSERGLLLPHLDHALDRFFRECSDLRCKVSA